MAKNYSNTWHRTANAVSADESALVLLQIDHVDLVVPVRIVNDRQDITVNGTLYQAFGFDISLPDDPESGLATATLTLDNVGRELIQWFEIADFSKTVTATISQVLRSAPNNVEWSITMTLENISVNTNSVSAQLSFENFLNVPAVAVNYTPVTARGLF